MWLKDFRINLFLARNNYQRLSSNKKPDLFVIWHIQFNMFIREAVLKILSKGKSIKTYWVKTINSTWIIISVNKDSILVFGSFSERKVLKT